MDEARSSGQVIDRDAAAALIEPLTELVVRAGAAILAVNRPAMKVEGKPDGTPVTEADLAADRIIGEGLARLFPDREVVGIACRDLVLGLGTLHCMTQQQPASR